MKIRWILSVAFGIVCAGLVLIWWMTGTAQPMLEIGTGTFSMRVARTEDQRQQGLSGTTSISENEALVFDFPREDTWGIWMKNMKYPIDIVWLDSSKKVIHIVSPATPESYPGTTFEPKKLAKYVIELKAGATDSKRITIGSQAVFDSTKGTFE